MGRSEYLQLRRLSDVPLSCCGVFHLRLFWNVAETYWRDVVITPSCYALLCHDVPIRHRGDVPLRRLGDVSPKRCWLFHLRRTCDVAETYRETPLQRRHDTLLLGGCIGFNWNCIDLLILCLKVKVKQISQIYFHQTTFKIMLKLSAIFF